MLILRHRFDGNPIYRAAFSVSASILTLIAAILLVFVEPAQAAESAAASVIACQPTNNVSTMCSELTQYVKTCGVICPDKTRKIGQGGCTIANASERITREDPIKHTKKGSKWCAATTITWEWSAKPQTAILTWTPSETPCHLYECEKEVADVLTKLQNHENEHVAIINELIGDLNLVWKDRSFEECVRTQKNATAALVAAITKAKEHDTKYVFEKINEEPHQARTLICSECRARRAPVPSPRRFGVLISALAAPPLL